MFKRGSVVLLLIVESACTGSSAPPPAAPSATSPSSVSVNCQTTALTTAQQTQCSSVVVLSDGTSQDQTLASQWSSGNASVASVSATGVVTAVSAGSVAITARFQGLPGAKTVAVALPASFTVTGTLTDGTSHGILPNITIQTVSGTNVGRSAVTDSNGNYVMTGLSPGTFTLSVSTVRYLTTTQQVTLSANTRVDLVLQRATLTSVTISCSRDYTLISQGETAKCAAMAHYSDGSSSVQTNGISWGARTTDCSGFCPSNGVASVDSTGLVTDTATYGTRGTVTITATFQGVSGTATFSIVGSCLIC